MEGRAPVRLLKELLDKVELTAPVIVLRLDARQLVPMLPPPGLTISGAGRDACRLSPRA